MLAAPLMVFTKFISYRKQRTRLRHMIVIVRKEFDRTFVLRYINEIRWWDASG